MEETTVSHAKQISDSGYGSSKSNSNSQSHSQKSSGGSSKSQRSSLSSEGHDDKDSNQSITNQSSSPPLHVDGKEHVLEHSDILPSPNTRRDTYRTELKHHHWEEFLDEQLKAENSAETDARCTLVFSLEDGHIMYMTPGFTNLLGVTCETSIGKNFVNCLHPNDRIPFVGHISGGGNSRTGLIDSYFCRIQQKSTECNSCTYCPCELSMKSKEIDLEGAKCGAQENIELENNPMLPIMCLLITAKLIKSAFTYPEECPLCPETFTTRHMASCNFGDFDSTGIGYLGHFPQDLIGTSILDYYHPEDMCNLKEIYEEVMFQQGRPFRSKPYRFRTFNGTFALMETDWSCFINPWTWKLEFIIGQHTVIRGPSNPDVFMLPPKNDNLKVSSNVLDSWQHVQREIKAILSETVSRTSPDPNYHPSGSASSWRRRSSTHHLESTSKVCGTSFKSGSECSHSFSLLGKDTVMLGEISPYHDDDQSGSNESSETPPSYGQLNYRDNIERFFQSHPKTAHSSESAEKMETNQSNSDGESKVSACPDYSSGSNNGNWSGSNESGDGESGVDVCLTEDVLSRHNDNMEKCFTQLHREHRLKNKHHKGDNSAKLQNLKRAQNTSGGKPPKIPHLDHSPTLHLPNTPTKLRSNKTNNTSSSAKIPFFTSRANTSEPCNGERGRGAATQKLSYSSLPKCHKSAQFFERIASSFKNCADTGSRRNADAILAPKFKISDTPGPSKAQVTQGSTSGTSQEPEESCSSSMYSLLRTDTTVTENNSCYDHMTYILRSNDAVAMNEAHNGTVNKLEIPREVLMHFQLPTKSVGEILAKDLLALARLGIHSSSINTQLKQLYSEFRRDNKVPHALLEDDGTTSSGNTSTGSDSDFKSSTECRHDSFRQTSENFDTAFGEPPTNTLT